MRKLLNKIYILSAAAGLWANVAAAEVLVIVHPSNPLASMTAQQVSQIFLGSSNTFPDGTSAQAVDLDNGAIRDEFHAKVLGKNAGQVKAIWSRIVFSGKGQPLREMAGAAEARAFVAGNPKGIAFVDKASADASVKVVFRSP